MLDCERMNGTITFQKITMSYSDSTIHTGSIRIFLEPTFAKIAILPDSLFIQCLYRFDVMSNYIFASTYIQNPFIDVADNVYSSAISPLFGETTFNMNIISRSGFIMNQYV
ncbi:Hypothetical_protein [Hexamita inflata]|uniref:Hypothetical_protein n=1 Tax=Hexamita inflata TaxID=28002 RepID=A0ABP1H4G4_9EUKA